MGYDELAVTRRSLRVVPGGFATTLAPGLRVDGSRVFGEAAETRARSTG